MDKSLWASAQEYVATLGYWSLMVIAALLLDALGMAQITTGKAGGALPGWLIVAVGSILLLVVPFIAFHRMRLKSIRLHERLDRDEPRLEIVFGSGPPFVEQQTVWIEGRGERRPGYAMSQIIYRVGVRNASPHTISRARIDLEDMNPRALPGLPLPLHKMNNNPPDMQYDHEFPIDGENTEYVDVCMQQQRQPLQQTWANSIYHAVSGIPNGLPANQSYSITLHAHGQDSRDDRMMLELVIDEQGGISLRPQQDRDMGESAPR